MRFMLAFAAASACLPVIAIAAQESTEGRVSSGANAASALEGVIVTARRREEDLQSVPAAVSVVNGDLLDSSYTVNTQQLSQLVPSLYYNSANPRNTAYTIRGLGSNTLSISAANDGIEPGVGFYVDQVYHARPATAAFDFTDIERVEVLRGPQGTLFGKNTTAGAIHVISREPTFEPEGNAEVSYGDDDFVQAKGCHLGTAVRGCRRRPPLGPDYAARWVADQRRHRREAQRTRQLRRARTVAVRAEPTTSSCA